MDLKNLVAGLKSEFSFKETPHFSIIDRPSEIEYLLVKYQKNINDDIIIEENF